jgi:ATP/maltotriose-dependent transcriptional regulator MalT
MPGAAPRPRLFGLLNELSQSPAVWIHGAPGAGKSTLVATYLAARGFKPIWYQVDSDDADPGSFFMHLIEATQRALA